MNSTEYKVRSIMAIVAIAEAADIAEAGATRRHRFNVRPYLRHRNFNIYQELKIEDRFGLKNFFRVSETDFEELISLIRPDIMKDSTWRNDVISPEMRLGVTLRFLATGDSYTSLMYHMRISKQQISKIVPEVCNALFHRLKKDYLKVSLFNALIWCHYSPRCFSKSLFNASFFKFWRPQKYTLIA